MNPPEPLPRTLFEEIGKVVVLWATIEQNVVLHASAMALLKTGGKTTEFLRMEFRRLREAWFKLCREHYEPEILDKVVTPLNMELCRLSEQRGLMVHGMWKHIGRGKFLLRCYEQKGQLVLYESEVTLRLLREIRHDSYLLCRQVERFTRNEHGFRDGSRPVLKTIAPLVPSDKT